MKNNIIKKPTYKDLADYLGVSESAVKQYSKVKRQLMIYGYWKMLEDNLFINIDNFLNK